MWLPTAVAGSGYVYEFKAPCDSSKLNWTGFVPPQLDMLLSTGGVLAGTPLQVTDRGPLEFQVSVSDGQGGYGVENCLIEIVAPDGGN
jgi:hypothetical protein